MTKVDPSGQAGLLDFLVQLAGIAYTAVDAAINLVGGPVAESWNGMTDDVANWWDSESWAPNCNGTEYQAPTPVPDLGFEGNHIADQTGSYFGKYLFANYWNSGGDIQLSTDRFDDVLKQCSWDSDTREWETVPLTDGGWGKEGTIVCNNSSEYARAFGTATLYIGVGGRPVVASPRS